MGQAEEAGAEVQEAKQGIREMQEEEEEEELCFYLLSAICTVLNLRPQR